MFISIEKTINFNVKKTTKIEKNYHKLNLKQKPIQIFIKKTRKSSKHSISKKIQLIKITIY